MSPDRTSLEPVPPAALAAFVRGVLRRAIVLAELHSGDAAVGDAAVAAAIRDWPALSRETAMGEWPVSFWSLLLSQPPLRDRARTPVLLPLQPSDRLGELAPEIRAALLLRIAAGLQDGQAEKVLGISEREYLLALRTALPGLPDASADVRVWNELKDEIKRRIRSVPATRLPTPGGTREAVPPHPHPPGDAPPSTPSVRRRWLLIGLWILLSACVIALVATWMPSTRIPWSGAVSDLRGVVASD